MHVPQQLYSPSTDTIVAKQPQNVSTPLYMTHSAFVDGQLSARLGDDIKSDDDGEVSSLNRCLIDLHNFSSHHLSPIRPLSKIRRTTPRPVLPKPPPKTINPSYLSRSSIPNDGITSPPRNADLRKPPCNCKIILSPALSPNDSQPSTLPRKLGYQIPLFQDGDSVVRFQAGYSEWVA